MSPEDDRGLIDRKYSSSPAPDQGTIPAAAVILDPPLTRRSSVQGSAEAIRIPFLE